MKLLVLDGNSILNRAFYGIKLLTTKAGDFTNGIYGFLTMLKKLLDETAPGGVAIAFDCKGPHLPPQRPTPGTRQTARACRRSWPSSCRCCRSCSPIWATALSPARGGRPTTSWAPWPPLASGRAASASSPTGDRDSLQLVSDSTSVRHGHHQVRPAPGHPLRCGEDPRGVRRHPPPDDRPEGHPRGIPPTASPGVAGIGPKGRRGAHPEVWQPAVSLRPPGGAGHQARHEGQTGEVQGQRLFELRFGHHPPGRPHRHGPLPL